MNLRLESLGPRAWLVRFATRVGDRAYADGQTLQRAVQAAPPPGLLEIVPAYTTLMLEFAPGALPSAAALRKTLRAALAAPTAESTAAARVVRIPVVYNGPDLARVATHAGLTERRGVALHTLRTYRVHLLGFAPGFAYLGGLDPRLHTPRLDSPRPRVPAGSVAIGGAQTAVYPLATPGGWNLIGPSPLPLFDPARSGEEAFLLRPGDEVRFVEEPAS